MQTALTLQHTPNRLLGIAGKTGLKKMSRTAYLKMQGIRGVYLFLRGHFTAGEIAVQLGASENEIFNILSDFPASPELSGLGSGNTASWMEFNFYMQDQLLRDADVMSMAHGLEIRVPFLDNEVIRTAFSVSEKIKFGNDLPKALLVRAFEDRLPAEIWKRKKMGFSFPFAEWLRNSEFVKQLEHHQNPHTRKAYADFMCGKIHWSRIMSLVVLENR